MPSRVASIERGLIGRRKPPHRELDQPVLGDAPALDLRQVGGLQIALEPGLCGLAGFAAGQPEGLPAPGPDWRSSSAASRPRRARWRKRTASIRRDRPEWFHQPIAPRRDRAVILQDEYAHLSTPRGLAKRVFRLGVKEVLTCDPKAAADPGFDESA